MTDDLVKRLRICAPFDPDQAEAADRIEELQEELRQLREDLTQDSPAFTAILSKQQSALLMGVYRRPFATYAYLDNITENFGAYNRYEGEMHQALRTRVAMWKRRKKIMVHGIEIHMKRGVGYYLDKENRTKIEKLLESL